MDSCLCLLIITVACTEFLSQLCLYSIVHFILAISSQLAEPLVDKSIVLVCHDVEKSFEVAGDKDIH